MQVGRTVKTTMLCLLRCLTVVKAGPYMLLQSTIV